MKITNRCLLVGLIIVFSLNLPMTGLAKSKVIDHAKMKRDLNIMKAILDRIMNPNNSGSPWNAGNSRALFLDGNGVVFIYQSNHVDELFSLREYNSPVARKTYFKAMQYFKKHKENTDEIIINIEGKKTDKEQSETKRKEIIQKKEKELKTNIIGFLGDYCDAINQLQSNDKISVVLLPFSSSYNSFVRILGHSNAFPELMVATVKKADISAYRKESINYNTFQKRVDFRIIEDNSSMAKDVQIMSGIFSSAFQHDSNENLAVIGDAWGTHLKDFGVLFMINARDSRRFQKMQFLTTGKNIWHNFFIDEMEADDDDFTERLKNTQSKIIEILGDYGHTLRKLKDSEWIGVALEFGGSQHLKSEKSPLIIKVRKKDVMAFRKDKINLREFKKRVLISR